MREGLKRQRTGCPVGIEARCRNLAVAHPIADEQDDVGGHGAAKPRAQQAHSKNPSSETPKTWSILGHLHPL